MAQSAEPYGVTVENLSENGFLDEQDCNNQMLLGLTAEQR